jgi:hypothetical protein
VDEIFELDAVYAVDAAAFNELHGGAPERPV